MGEQLLAVDEALERLLDELLAGPRTSKIPGRKTKKPPLTRTSERLTWCMPETRRSAPLSTRWKVWGATTLTSDATALLSRNQAT
jgi:hypothetical protein